MKTLFVLYSLEGIYGSAIFLHISYSGMKSEAANTSDCGVEVYKPKRGMIIPKGSYVSTSFLCFSGNVFQLLAILAIFVIQFVC